MVFNFWKRQFVLSLALNENVFLARQAVATFYSRGKNLFSAKWLLRINSEDVIVGKEMHC